MKEEKEIREGWALSEEPVNLVLVVTQNYWGRGKCLEQALSNLPSHRRKDEIQICTCHIPAGTEYELKNSHGIENEFWMDNMGSIHYPKEASFMFVCKNPIKLKSFTKFEKE